MQADSQPKTPRAPPRLSDSVTIVTFALADATDLKLGAAIFARAAAAADGRLGADKRGDRKTRCQAAHVVLTDHHPINR
jgi:hypothetical protein